MTCGSELAGPVASLIDEWREPLHRGVELRRGDRHGHQREPDDTDEERAVDQQDRRPTPDREAPADPGDDRLERTREDDREEQEDQHPAGGIREGEQPDDQGDADGEAAPAGDPALERRPRSSAGRAAFVTRDLASAGRTRWQARSRRGGPSMKGPRRVRHIDAPGPAADVADARRNAASRTAASGPTVNAGRSHDSPG